MTKILIDRSTVEQALGLNSLLIEATDTLRAALAQQAEPEQEPVAWNWMQDGVPFGPAYYGKPPDDDIARVAEKHGKTVRLLYANPLT